MKFTKEQLERGIAVVYGSQVTVCHSAQEAVEAINSYKGRWGMLRVNPTTEKNLNTLFAGEEYGDTYTLPYLKTTNCSNQAIKLYPALAPTLEEHQRLYKEQCEKEKAERLAQAKAWEEKRLAEFTEVRKGWYSVEIEIITLDAFSFKRCYKTFSGKIIADSKMHAYNKAAVQMNDYCAGEGYILESIAEWKSGNTHIEYLGIKTDEGYRLD